MKSTIHLFIIITLLILPALSSAWKTWHIYGIMARGGFEVNIDWENGTLKQARITSKLGNQLKLSYHGKMVEIITTEKGKSY
jgi:alpha-L-fucosidase 2